MVGRDVSVSEDVVLEVSVIVGVAVVCRVEVRDISTEVFFLVDSILGSDGDRSFFFFWCAGEGCTGW